MIREIKKYYCDICKEEQEKNKIKMLKVPVKVMCSQDDGKPMKIPYITVKEIDVCNTCLEKVTVVEYGYREVKGLKSDVNEQ